MSRRLTLHEKINWLLLVWVIFILAATITSISNQAFSEKTEVWEVVKSGECYAYRRNSHILPDCYKSHIEARTEMNDFIIYLSQKKQDAAKKWVDAEN